MSDIMTVETASAEDLGLPADHALSISAIRIQQCVQNNSEQSSKFSWTYDHDVHHADDDDVAILVERREDVYAYRGKLYRVLHRGSGYMYAPYVPLTRTTTVLDPASYNPPKSFATKYSKKLLNQAGRYYSKVTIGDLVDPITTGSESK